MAQITEVRLLDDLDGGEAAESVSFSLDGKSYEIDLNEKHAAALRDAFAPFIGSAGRGRRPPPRSDRALPEGPGPKVRAPRGCRGPSPIDRFCVADHVRRTRPSPRRSTSSFEVVGYTAGAVARRARPRRLRGVRP